MFRQRVARYHKSNPWREMAQLQQQLNRVFYNKQFDEARQYVAPSYPAINIWTNDDGVILTAELPGVKAEDIDISVVGDILTLSGSRDTDEIPESAKYHRQERKHGEFNRTFQFPFEVEADGVDAMFQNGVLHISLAKTEREKPKRIAVHVA